MHAAKEKRYQGIKFYEYLLISKQERKSVNCKNACKYGRKKASNRNVRKPTSKKEKASRQIATIFAIRKQNIK